MAMYPEDEPKSTKQPIDFNLQEKVNEEQRKILMELVEVMGVKELSARTDRLEHNIEQISQAMNQLIESNNKIANIVSGTVPTTTSGSATLAPGSFDKIQAFGQLMDTAATAWQKIKGHDSQPQNFFGLDAETINNEIRESAMGNFEIGKAIQQNLKSKLMQKTMAKVLGDTLSHEPI